MGERSLDKYGIQWEDDLQWMEQMSGERWDRFVRGEQRRYNKVLSTVTTNIDLIEKELERSKSLSNTNLLQAGEEIEIGYDGGAWRWKNGSEMYSMEALDYCKKIPGYVWVIEETAGSKGRENYCVRSYSKDKKAPRWTINVVGPFVAVVGGRCYYLEAKNKLVYYRLMSVDAKTGKGRKLHYLEKDYRYNLELRRGSCSQAFLIRQAGEKQDCFSIESNSLTLVRGVSLESRRFITTNKQNKYLYYESKRWWLSKDLDLSRLRIPLGRGTPELLHFTSEVDGYFVTKWYGQRTLWRLEQDKTPRFLWQGIGQVKMDDWDGPWIRFVQPGREIVWWNPYEESSHRFLPLYTRTISARRNFILIEPSLKNTNQNKKLLVIGYGAYGLATNMSTARWEPLLQRGWSLAIAILPGGGDHTPEFEDLGRVAGRERVLEEAEKVVREAQKATHIHPSNTVIYGRSAGGLWVGGLVAKYRNGELFGGAYMEVPYLDVLATTTNKSLPLTLIETDEFGLPSQRISDLRSILNWSPMELLQLETKEPKVWQLVRTGVNDSEVFAYESAKWRVRSGSKCILAIEENQGHFISGKVGQRQQAEDLGILLELVEKKY